MANPYTALAVAIAVVAAGLYLWYSNTQKVVSGQDALTSAIAQGDKSASSEVATLDRLFAASTNMKSSVEERKAAYKSLQELYPAYFKNLDFENLKNAQSVGIYKELRQAIFDKARASAIDSELKKRAEERLGKELEIQEKIQKTRERIKAINEGGNKIILQEESLSRGTAEVAITKAEALATQFRLLREQKIALLDLTKESLKSDQVLLNSKAEYDAKTSKLTENEIERQKALIAANALQVESNNALKANTIAYFESLIEQAQKEQKEVSITGKEFDALQAKIDAYQKKIDAISKSGRVLPKPQLPTLEEEGVITPSFSLEELQNQLSYYEELRNRFATTSDQYKALSEQINNTKTKINAIEGVEEFSTSIDETKTKLDDFNKAITESFTSAVVAFAEGFGEIIGKFAEGGASLQNIGGLVFNTLGNLAIQVGKIAIATGIAVSGIKKALQSLNPAIAIAGGIALIALGTLVKSQLGNAGSFANGGVVGGSSFYGDRLFARVNSGEMILNTKQQRSLYNQLDTNSGAVVTMIPDLRIEGSDLIVVFDRATSKNSRFGK